MKDRQKQVLLVEIKSSDKDGGRDWKLGCRESVQLIQYVEPKT